MFKICIVAGLCLAGTAAAALAGPAVDTAYPSPAMGSGMVRDASLRYPAGAYFYGSDCGGNSEMKAASLVKFRVQGGLILEGAAGHSIANALNCDDRRHALSSYRDAFEGKAGAAHDWRNENGGGHGSVSLVRRYSRAGVACSEVMAITSVSPSNAGHNVSACRQQDGNWHTN